MTLENQAILSNYIELTSLDSNSKVWLVRDVTNFKIYVKKIVVCETPSIYFQLQNAHIKGIPEIYHVIETDDNEVIIIEEYIHGETANQIQLSYCEAINMGIQICNILSATHNLNPSVICRDIKPSNIMKDNGSYYLTDFNIARSYEPNQAQDTHLLGTANYAAPEQYGFGQTDARSDIYSLGVTLNVLLTGKLPLEDLVEGELGKIIYKATQIDPNNRYQTANEMSAALNKVLKSLSKEKLPSRLKRKSTLVAIILYPIWFCFLVTCVYYEGSPEQSTMANWATRIFFFLVAFIPYIYNANYLGFMDYTLATYKHGTIKYWLMRLLFTLLFGLIIPFTLVLFFVQ